MTEQPFHIVFPLYPGVTHLDFTGPHQVLRQLPNARLTVASMGGANIESDGLTFAQLDDLTLVDSCDMICVPGGFGTAAAMGDPLFMAQIDRLAGQARYLTSVCTGSLILAAAGRLKGKRAACHWAWRELLTPMGAIPDDRRVVRDGDIITGGGVTAGIDFALTVAAELAGPDVAQAIQLGLEYAPQPPFNAGRPDTAPPHILAAVQRRLADSAPSRSAAADAAGARLEAVASA